MALVGKIFVFPSLVQPERPLPNNREVLFRFRLNIAVNSNRHGNTAIVKYEYYVLQPVLTTTIHSEYIHSTNISEETVLYSDSKEYTNQNKFIV